MDNLTALYNQDLDNEYIANQLGLTYDELMEVAEEKDLTPYQLLEEKMESKRSENVKKNK